MPYPIDCQLHIFYNPNNFHIHLLPCNLNPLFTLLPLLCKLDYYCVLIFLSLYSFDFNSFHKLLLIFLKYSLMSLTQSVSSQSCWITYSRTPEISFSAFWWKRLCNISAMVQLQSQYNISLFAKTCVSFEFLWSLQFQTLLEICFVSFYC